MTRFQIKTLQQLVKHSLPAIAIGIGAWLPLQLPSYAGEILERVAQTGVLRVGAQTDAIPFGFQDESGQWQGYSVDILNLLGERLEAKLGRPVQLEFTGSNPQNRFDLVSQNLVDIECGTATFTWEREGRVDFTLSYFPNGTQLLVEQGDADWSIPALVGRKIGIVANTTNEAAMRGLQPRADFVYVRDRFEGFEALQAGDIDGLASDGITLEGLRYTTETPEAWDVVPDLPYVLESFACIVPHDESEWRDFVNVTLAGFMQGVVNNEPAMISIYERWFGDDGLVPYPQDLVSNYFFSIVNTLEWLPRAGNWAE
ncbi:MAG: amino acid ABC transporter substrate-binding protein [Cyanobacteria bacterium P01_H01_bin.121]